MPLYVRKLFDTFQVEGAYAAAVVLALLALIVLVGMNLIQRRDKVAAAPTTIAVTGALTSQTEPDNEESS